MNQNNNRYVSITRYTTDINVQILDTIIRFPYPELMTREALVIRESVPIIAQQLFGTNACSKGMTKTRVVCITLGSGWTPFPETPIIDKRHIGTYYRTAITEIAEYLVQEGKLYEDLLVA